MARKTKYITATSGVGRKFATRRNDMSLAQEFNVSNVADLEAYRLIRLNANNELEKADHNSPSWEGVHHSGTTVSAGSPTDFVAHGHARFIANSAVEVGEIKAAEDGRICGFIRSSTGGRTILSAIAGEAGEITDTDANDETISVVSTSSSDTGVWVLVIGKEKTTGNAIMEYITLDGTDSSSGSRYFDEVYGAIILDQPNLEGTPTAAVGTVTITNTTSETTLITIAATANNMGVNTVTSEYAFDRRVYATIDSLAAANLMLVGYDYANDETVELITFTATTGITKMTSTNRFNRIVYEVCGGVPDGNTIAIAAAPNEDIVNGWTNNTHQTTTDVGADQGADSTLEVVSDSTEDTTQSVTVAWKNAAGTWSVTTVDLNGTTHVSIGNGDTVVGAYLSAATAGNISIIYDRASTNVTLLAWDGSSYLGAGMLSTWEGNASYSGIELDARNGSVTFTCSNASATDMLYVLGEDVNGSSQGEGLTLSSGTATTSNKYSRITHIFCSGTESTEYFRIHNGTDDNAALRIGKLLQPADAQGDIVEGIKY